MKIATRSGSPAASKWIPPQARSFGGLSPRLRFTTTTLMIRMSYPDLVEDGGKYFLTETQKDIARVHEIDTALLEGLWNQSESKSVAKDGLILELPRAERRCRTPPICHSYLFSTADLAELTMARRICEPDSRWIFGQDSDRWRQAKSSLTIALRMERVSRSKQ